MFEHKNHSKGHPKRGVLTRLVSIVGATAMLTAGGLAVGAAANATPAPYVITAWQMPSYTNSTTATWPQTLALHQETSSTSLDQLDSQMKCGTAYQVDLYNNDATTTSLLAGGNLTSSNNPKESLIAGAWGTAYKVVKTGACAVTPPVVDKCAANFGSGMWEISWGRQFSDTNGTTTFTMASYGGMTSLNGAAVPAYMVNANNWRWLYVHKPVTNATWDYGFKDGTHITAVVTADGNSCPSIVWTVIKPKPVVVTPPVTTPPATTPPVTTPPATTTPPVKTPAVTTPPVVTPPVVTPPKTVTPPVAHHTTFVPQAQHFEANTGVTHSSIFPSWMVWTAFVLMSLIALAFLSLALRANKEGE